MDALIGIGILIVLMYIGVRILLFLHKWQVEADRKQEEKRRQKQAEQDAAQRRADARRKAEDLVKRGAIFAITTTSDIPGYHLKELGWVSCECEERSAAEHQLRIFAADKFKSSNALTKLTYSIRTDRIEDGESRSGKQLFRTIKIKVWEAMACEAIDNQAVDKSPVQWNYRSAVIDGSNVAYWADEDSPSLDAVQAIVRLLKEEKSSILTIFDANIGYKIAGKHMDVGDFVRALGNGVEIEVVKAGTVADRRIVEVAEQRKATIISNDLFRDSRRARPIPKRRGFFIREYDYAELLDPRA